MVHAPRRGGGRAVGQADLLRGTSTLNLTGGVVRLAPKGPWLLVKSRKGGSAKGYSHSLVDTGATNGKFYDARQLADEIYAVVVDVASKCRCDPATPRIYAKPIGLDNGMVKYRLCTSSFDGRTCLTLTHDKFFQNFPQLYPPPTSMVVTVAEGAAADAVDAANFPLVTVFADIAGLGVRGGQDGSFVNRAGLSEAARAANTLHRASSRAAWVGRNGPAEDRLARPRYPSGRLPGGRAA